MAQKKANPAIRFLVAFLIVVAIAAVAFFVGYLIGMRLAVPASAAWVAAGRPLLRSSCAPAGRDPGTRRRRPARSSSPAPPATWAAASCRACWRPASRVRVPRARPDSSRRGATGPAAWRSSPATSCGRRRSPRALAGVERRLLPRALAWPAATASTSATVAGGQGLRPRRRRRRRRAASSTSAASGDPAADLSQHLRSRHETGEALRDGGVPVTEFRAAVVVGAGSVSFEMIRYLTERLPVMVCPRWVYTRVQPIAVRRPAAPTWSRRCDVPDSAGRIVEIGGADVLTYGEMMLGYADGARPHAASAARARAHARRSRRTGSTWSRPSRRRSRGR